MKKIIMPTITATAIIFLIIYPKTVISSSVQALDTCINVLMPTLFPFFVLSRIFVGCGGSELLGTLFTPIMKPLFRINGYGATPFVMGITCGYPVGAKTVVDMYKKSLLNKKEAENLICFSNNSGPLFIIGAVGTGFLSSAKAGMFLYIIHILSAITVGILLKFTLPHVTSVRRKTTNTPTVKNVFINAVESSVLSVLNVFAYVIFFAIIIGIISETGIFHAVADLFKKAGISKSISIPTLYSILEMTTGIKMLNANDLAFSTRLIITSFMLGWSGFSIHFQTKGILSNTDLSFARYLLIKLFHGILSSAYACIGLFFINIDKSVFIINSFDLSSEFHVPDAFIFATGVICIIYFIMLDRLRNNNRYSKPKQIKAK